MSIAFLDGISARPARHFFSSRSMVLVLGLWVIPATAAAQVRETPNRWIRGVAKVTLDRNGNSQIAFNPQICRQLGPDLCEFFRTHEYGHVNLRHLERGVAAPQAEAEADIWAARNASPSAVRAAKEFFLSGKGGSRVHGTPQERARRMDAGWSSSTKSSASAHAATQRSVPQRKRTGSKPPPKSYSATSKKWVRYRVIPSQTTAITTRHVVLTPSKVTQPRLRVSPRYVPRGDFLNPR